MEGRCYWLASSYSRHRGQLVRHHAATGTIHKSGFRDMYDASGKQLFIEQTRFFMAFFFLLIWPFVCHNPNIQATILILIAVLTKKTLPKFKPHIDFRHFPNERLHESQITSE